MNRTRIKYIVAVVSIIAAVILVLLYNPAPGEEFFLEIRNDLPDITITEIYFDNNIDNQLADPLEPGECTVLPLPVTSCTIRAIDESDGCYSLQYVAPTSMENISIEISMVHRTVFERTIESGGEYWTGSGTATIRVTNELRERDIYLFSVTSDASTGNASDRLGAFILFPGKTLNVRVSPSRYSLTAEDDHRQIYESTTGELSQTDTFSWSITESDKVVLPEESGTGSSRLILCNALDDWIVTGLYHKSSSDSSWSQNHLFATGIEPKEQYFLLLDPGTYDVRVVDEDNDSYTRLGVIVSEETTCWNITMNDLDPFIP